MVENSFLLFIPARGEFLKIQPGTGDNLSPEDISAGFTDYVIWNRFRPGPLDIDGELEMECVDGGIVLLKDDDASIASASPRNDIAPTFPIHDVLGKVLNYAHGQIAPVAIPLLW